MNIAKFRPVGRPSGPIATVRVSQSKRAIGASKAPSIAQATRYMLAKGYVRAGVRHG